MSKFRNYVFTQNNYPNTELVDGLSCRYIVYGKEVGESGTPHLQGFVSFPCPRSLSGVIKSLPGCHVEVCRNVPAAIEYCKKDGEWVDRGVAPLEHSAVAKKTNAERWALAKEGRFEELSPESIRVYEYIYKKHRPNPEILQELSSEWYYGAPGTGKTRKALEENPGAYIKDPKTVWWDSYEGQDVVIIDDFDKYQVSQGGDMKRWLDRYPFQAQFKGGSQVIRPTKIIVTSNYHPDEIWEDQITQDAITRRVKITHFNKFIS